jgi:integrase
LIFGIAGACRSDELTNVTVDDIETSNSSLIIKIPKTKTKIPRVFVVTNIEGKVDFIGLFRKYADLRPSNVSHRRFFIFYKGGKCTSQPVGKNTFGKIPSIIATYLDLPNPSMYTGHCLRRSSATLLADSGADITTIKRWLRGIYKTPFKTKPRLQTRYYKRDFDQQYKPRNYKLNIQKKCFV